MKTKNVTTIAALAALLLLSRFSDVSAVRGGINTAALRKLRAQQEASNDVDLPVRGSRRLAAKHGPKERECDITEKSSEIKFSCKSKYDDKEAGTKIHDSIEYRVRSNSDGASIEVKYKNKEEIDKVETETKTQYKILFDKIVEYISSNDDGSYSFENNDEQLTVIELREWDDFSEIVTDDDGVESYFYLTTPDGMVEFNFTVSRADEGEVATANKMKIDFRLTNFPWAQNDTHVALFCVVESKQKVDVKRGPGSKKGKAKDVTIPFDQAVEDTGIVPFGEYTWASTAEATSNVTERAMDSEDVPVTSATDLENDDNSTEITVQSTSTIEVIATSPETQEDSNKQIIAFAFVGQDSSGADEIYWDPEAGIGYASGGFKAVAFSGAMITAIAGALAVLFLV